MVGSGLVLVFEVEVGLVPPGVEVPHRADVTGLN